MHKYRVGVLAFHGDVIEHIHATKQAAINIKLAINIIQVRTKEHIQSIDSLIIPGGESTTLYTLCEEAGIWQEMKKVKNIFGTCAGAIMLSKKVLHKESSQKTLELMDLTIDRNSYGSQTDSFEENITTKLGKINAVFIRAPRIIRVANNVTVLAKRNKEIVACEEKMSNNYYLLSCFHPELVSSLFHEHFLKQAYFIK